jgi:hypothetical protein
MPSNKQVKGKRSYGLGGSKGAEFEIELPSGNVCLARPLGLSDLISAGVVDSLDSLTAMVNDLHITRVRTGKPRKREEVNPEDLATFNALTKDKVKFQKLLDLVDAIVVKALIEPQVFPNLSNGESEKRNGAPIPDNAYRVGDVDMLDKFKIFSEVVGPMMNKAQAMEPFRRVGAEPVADVEHGEVVPGTAVDDDGDR